MEYALQAARIAAHALNLITGELGFGTYGHKFSGEYEEDWAQSVDSWRALIHGRHVASVFIDRVEAPGLVSVVVSNVYDLIRPNALGDFDPLAYGIELQEEVNWMGDKTPDLECDVVMTEIEIPGLDGPRRDLPRATLLRKPKCFGALTRMHSNDR